MSVIDNFLRDLLQEEPWRHDARCLGAGPDAFFPKRGESQRPAKILCAECPVTVECAEHAHVFGEEYGIWGGKIRQRSGKSPSDLHATTGTRDTFTSSPASEEMDCDPEDPERIISTCVRVVPRPLAG